MKPIKTLFTAATLLSATALFNPTAMASDDAMYEITVTNITQGEIFTPIMAVTHTHGVKLFEIGEPASNELEQMAEGGDTGPLINKLVATGETLDVATTSDVLFPGASVTLNVRTDRKHAHVSVASMLVPTNDAFFAVNGIHGPRGKSSKTVFSPAYDAGTENNDESCAHIPGPPFACTGEGYNPAGGEGYVYIHPGIHGQGDLSAASYDWRNPVAKIQIRRVK